MERPVQFRSKNINLFGILHTVGVNGKKVCVIFLNSGLQYRVGPHRMYVKAARRLNEAGFAALRLDFPGLGDSDGEIRDIHYDCFDIEDTLNAVDFVIKEEKAEKVVLLGLCGGARNALKAALKDRRVDSVVLWSLPIRYAVPGTPSAKLASRTINNAVARYYLKGWMKKALSVKAWRRAVSSYRNLPVKDVFLGLMPGARKWEGDAHGGFLDAFRSLVLSGRPALFVYGERDVILKEEFEAMFKEVSRDSMHACECLVVPGGDHTFASIETEKDVIEKTAVWLEHLYGLNEKNLKGVLHATSGR